MEKNLWTASCRCCRKRSRGAVIPLQCCGSGPCGRARQRLVMTFAAQVRVESPAGLIGSHNWRSAALTPNWPRIQNSRSLRDSSLSVSDVVRRRTPNAGKGENFLSHNGVPVKCDISRDGGAVRSPTRNACPSRARPVKVLQCAAAADAGPQRTGSCEPAWCGSGVTGCSATTSILPNAPSSACNANLWRLRSRREARS